MPPVVMTVQANAGKRVLYLIVRQLGEKGVYNGERKIPKIFFLPLR